MTKTLRERIAAVKENNARPRRPHEIRNMPVSEATSLLSDLKRKLEVAAMGLQKIEDITYLRKESPKHDTVYGKIWDIAKQTLTLISLDNQPGE